MTTLLSRENANKITKVEKVECVVLPSSVFKQGEMLILFNNSDQKLVVKSEVEETYVSGSAGVSRSAVCPARGLVNILFIEENLVVLSMGAA